MHTVDLGAHVDVDPSSSCQDHVPIEQDDSANPLTLSQESVAQAASRALACVRDLDAMPALGDRLETSLSQCTLQQLDMITRIIELESQMLKKVIQHQQLQASTLVTRSRQLCHADSTTFNMQLPTDCQAQLQTEWLCLRDEQTALWAQLVEHQPGYTGPHHLSVSDSDCPWQTTSSVTSAEHTASTQLDIDCLDPELAAQLYCGETPLIADAQIQDAVTLLIALDRQRHQRCNTSPALTHLNRITPLYRSQIATPLRNNPPLLAKIDHHTLEMLSEQIATCTQIDQTIQELSQSSIALQTKSVILNRYCQQAADDRQDDRDRSDDIVNLQPACQELEQQLKLLRQRREQLAISIDRSAMTIINQMKHAPTNNYHSHRVPLQIRRVKHLISLHQMKQRADNICSATGLALALLCLL